MPELRDRLIFALDVNTLDEAKTLVNTLGDSVSFYKIGLEFCMTGHYFELMQWLVEQNKKVFADLKFFDIPETVGRAVAQLATHGAHFVTVHGDSAIMQAAVANSGDTLKVLAVTVLTSMDDHDLAQLGYQHNVQDLVAKKASDALAAGCYGVISSGHEAGLIKTVSDQQLATITPGIRPAVTSDDQKRTMTPSRAIQQGADYLVVGRPIRNADGPRAAAEAIQEEIKRAFEAKH